MEMSTMLLRTLFTYFFILVLLRLMGKRELGKLSVFDMVISIMLAEMAVLAIEDVREPAITFYLPMLLIAILEIVMAFITLKSKKLRDVVDGKSEVLIERGQIREDVLRRNRLNYDDLLVHLRQKNINNLADVEFAILEPTGQMSVFPKNEKSPVSREDLQAASGTAPAKVKANGLPVTLVMDGKIMEDSLRKLGQTKFWLFKELRKHGVKHVKDVSFCNIDHNGRLFVDLKDQTRRDTD